MPFNQAKGPKPFLLFAALLAAILAVLFFRAFDPSYVVFSNDGPLGNMVAADGQMPGAFFRFWQDLTVLGSNVGAAAVNVTNVLRWVLGPYGYSSFLPIIGLWILGVGAWFFCRRAGLGQLASVLTGIAACLTTNYFSNVCWGAVPPIIAFGLDFFALGALVKRDKLPFWVAPALAGLAVGINVMEAADIGALFSLLLATFVVYQSLVENGAPILVRAGRGALRTIIVAVFAFFIAIYAIDGLLAINVTGVVGTQQDKDTKAARWGFATEWSLPKRETLSLFIPGLFGDRIDFNDDRIYWGGMGRDLSWDQYFHEKLEPGDTVTIVFGQEQGVAPQIASNGELTLPLVGTVKAAGLTRFELQKKLSGLYASTSLKGASIQYASGFMRHTGRGFYFGLLVVLVALWGVLQALQKTESVFTRAERRLIWFWAAIAVISVILAHGRFSPFVSFYYWLYMVVPYLSTVRSPEKFLHLACFATIILFAYGMDGLVRRFLAIPFSPVPFRARLSGWWSKASAFERRWVIGSCFAIVLGLVGWMIYGVARPAVELYMQDVQIPQPIAHEAAGYSLRQVGWFLLFLVFNSALLFLIFTGFFAGGRAKWAGLLLGLLLVGDLAHADLQFIDPVKEGNGNGFWNYKQKYETENLNPVAKFLAQKPYEYRVAELPFPLPPQLSYFSELYGIEWSQQLFVYHNIQSLDIIQMARMQSDLAAFKQAIGFPGTPPLTRFWELTNTRYLLGPAGYVDLMNQQLDPALKRFRIVMTFSIEAKPGVENPTLPSDYTAVAATNGEYALIEFTGALPRAKLYSAWETNSPAALSRFTTTGLSPVERQVFDMVGTNGLLTLQRLMSPSFDPARSVLLSQPISTPSNSATANQNASEVEYVNYNPEDIKLKANAATSSILLLNDKYDPNWQVWVDGKRAELLRCNFVMRGVFLEPGQHQIEFLFRPPVNLLYVNLAAIVAGIGLLGYVAVAKRKENLEEEHSVERPSHAPAK